MDTPHPQGEPQTAKSELKEREAFEPPRLEYIKPDLVKRTDVAASTFAVVPGGPGPAGP